MANAPPPRVALFTSYTADYQIGHVASRVNRAYCERHGYEWLCRVQPPSTRHPLRHPTWDKVSLLIELLSSLLDGTSASCDAGTTHLLWIDGDAVVLRHERRVEEILALAPPTAELVVGEDVTQCCLVNAGVLLVRVSEWSLALWRDVWEAPSSEKFHNARFHEQSSLLKQLNARHEGLGRVKPFHSFLGGPAGPKVFPHVCVLPRHALNTNRGDLRRGAPAEPAPDDRCDFIFHACGVPHVFTDEGKCKSKIVALRAMLRSAGLEALAAFDDAAPGGVVPAPAVLREARAEDLAHIALLVAENECLINLERDTGAGSAVLERIGALYVESVLRGELSSWEAVQQRYAAPGSRLWVLIEEGGGAVRGCVGAIQHDAERVELVRMYVDRSLRRQGAGRRLFEHLLAHARGLGARSITLTTPSANTVGLAFYERLGFRRARTFSVAEEAWEGASLELSELVRAVVVDDSAART